LAMGTAIASGQVCACCWRRRTLRQNDQYGRARTVTNDFPSKSVCHNWQTGKEDDMNRLLAITVTALAMGLTPAMATEDSLPPTNPPTANTVPPEASKSATIPPSGSADTSGGATEQSSSPPSAGSTRSKMGTVQVPTNPAAPGSQD